MRMRTGAEYRAALRDGRKVWVLGEGRVEDVTTHPATRPMVEEYVAWYDRHFDPAWQDIILTPPDAAGERRPWGYVLPKSADDLTAMARSFCATTFPTGWLAKAEFTLGLALACTHAMGLVAHEPTIEYLIDLISEVQTVRSCQIAAERDPQFTPQGWCYPNHCHVAAGSIAMLRARQRISEILRILPGSSLVVAPSDDDLAAPELAAGLEESFAGGGYTARQRTALLQLAWDHVSSALDARESVFELHANGGIPAWRGRLRRSFDRYNELANGVLRSLDIDMPQIDLGSIPAAPIAPRRVVQPRASAA